MTEEVIQATTAEEVIATTPEAGGNAVDFGQISGGAYQSWDDAHKEIEELRSFRQQVEARSKEPEEVFANPVAKSVNEMFKNGATQAEVNNFFRLQGIDVHNLTPEQAIKERLRLEFPDVSPSDIEDEFAARYRHDPEDEQSVKDYQRKLKFDAPAAKKALSEKILQAGEPESVRIRKEQGEKVAQLAGAWTDGLSGMKEVKVPLSHKVDDFEYTYELPLEVGDEVRKSLAEYSAQEGIGFSQDALQKAQATAAGMIFARDPQKFINQAVRDAVAKAMEHVTRKYENNTPPERKQATETIATPTAEQLRNKLLGPRA
jgi:hypothetical protein